MKDFSKPKVLADAKTSPKTSNKYSIFAGLLLDNIS